MKTKEDIITYEITIDKIALKNKIFEWLFYIGYNGVILSLIYYHLIH